MAKNNNSQFLNIKEGVIVDNLILEKIQMLSMKKSTERQTEDQKSSNIEGIDKSKSEVAQKIDCLDHEIKNDILFWKINDSIYLIPESTAAKTSMREKRNNIDNLIKFLDQTFKDNYLVITFRKTRISNLFRRCLSFDDIQNYNLLGSYKLAQVCNFWMNLGEKKVIFIEIKNGFESSGLFMISCLLSYSKFYLSAEVALNALLLNNQTIWKFTNIETILRYVKYYDFVISQPFMTKVPQLVLNQMIVTTIPSIIQSGDFKPKLRIETNSKIFEFSTENCYKDTDYVIFSNLESEIAGDVKFSLVFEQENKTYHIFDLWINSLFYTQGLYRYSRSDIITLLPQESIYRFFQNSFCIDLIFLENQEKIVKNPFTVPMSMLELLNLIVSKISDECIGDEGINEYYIKMIEKGLNSVLAKLCAQLHLSEEESLALHSRLEESGYKSGILRKHFELKIANENTKESLKIEKYEDKPLDLQILYEKLETSEFGEVDLIDDENFIKEIPKKTASGLFKRNKQLPSNLEIRENIFARKPLHLVSLKQIENTIFEELKNINIPVDLKAVESTFCEKINENNNHIEEIKNVKKHKLESKREFMASLLFKQLEIKKILIDELDEILRNSPEKLGLQELSGLYKVIPSSEEILLFEKIPKDEISDIEANMLKLSKIPDITRILKVLIFERSCIEEIILIEKLIDNANSMILKILADNNLKYILKTVLELSNILNYTYGRKRNTIEGFKMESLYLLGAYKDAKDISFVDFLVEILRKNGVILTCIFRDFKDLNNLKNEDFISLKDKINNVIVKYKEVCSEFAALQECDKSVHSKILSFSYKKLLLVSEKYKDFERNSNILRIKMGEEDKKSISSIFKCFSDFFTTLELSMKKFPRKLN